MKKLIKSIVAMVMVCCLLFTLTGCISSDWTRVEENLIDEGYEVVAVTDLDSIEEFLEEMLINAEYTAVNPKEVNCVIMANKGSKLIFIAFCESRAVAKKIREKAEELIIDFAKLTGVNEKDCEVGRDGKVAYIGHKDAVDAAD